MAVKSGGGDVKKAVSYNFRSAKDCNSVDQLCSRWSGAKQTACVNIFAHFLHLKGTEQNEDREGKPDRAYPNVSWDKLVALPMLPLRLADLFTRIRTCCVRCWRGQMASRWSNSGPLKPQNSLFFAQCAAQQSQVSEVLGQACRSCWRSASLLVLALEMNLQETREPEQARDKPAPKEASTSRAKSNSALAAGRSLPCPQLPC